LLNVISTLFGDNTFADIILGSLKEIHRTGYDISLSVQGVTAVTLYILIFEFEGAVSMKDGPIVLPISTNSDESCERYMLYDSIFQSVFHDISALPSDLSETESLLGLYGFVHAVKSVDTTLSPQLFTAVILQ
jgi:hypothetical protein